MERLETVNLPDYKAKEIEIGQEVYALEDLCSKDVSYKIKKKIIQKADINREVLKFALLHDLPEDLIIRIVRRCEKIDEPFYIKVKYQDKMVYTALELAVLQNRSDQLIKAITHQESDYAIVRWLYRWFGWLVGSSRVSSIREAVMKEIEIDNQPFELVMIPEVVVSIPNDLASDRLETQPERPEVVSPFKGLVFSEPKRQKREWRHEIEHNFRGLHWEASAPLRYEEERLVREVISAKGTLMESLLLNHESDLKGVMDLETQDGSKLYQHLMMPGVNIRLQKRALKHQLQLSADRLVKRLFLKTPDQEIMSFLKNTNGLVLSMSPKVEIQRSDFVMKPTTILDLAVVLGSSDALIEYLYKKKHGNALKSVKHFKEERLMDMLCNASGKLILTPGMVAAYPEMLCDIRDDEGNSALEVALEGNLSALLITKLLKHMTKSNLEKAREALVLVEKEELMTSHVFKKGDVFPGVKILSHMHDIKGSVKGRLKKFRKKKVSSSGEKEPSIVFDSKTLSPDKLKTEKEKSPLCLSDDSIVFRHKGEKKLKAAYKGRRN